MYTTGQTKLVTGASSGIGAILAEYLARAGNRVIACGRDSGRLAEVAARAPGIETERVDVRDGAQVEALAARQGPALDILINNAAILQALSLLEPGHFARAADEVETNLLGMMRVVDAFLPHMLERGPAAIVNVTSALAFVPDARYPVYSTTKAAQHAYTRALRHQLRDTNVTVFELMPPLTDTPMAAHVTGIPKLAPQKLAAALIGGLARDRLEIAPGLSAATRLMSRIAPDFTFRKLNA